MIPAFAPVIITDPAPAELHDFRTLHTDWSDISSPGVVCYAALYDAWMQKFGYHIVHDEVLGDVEAPVEHPGNGMEILFAVTPSGGVPVIGAGALFNVEVTSATEDNVDLVCDILVVSAIPGVEQAVIAGADGFVAVSLEEGDPTTTVHLR